MALMSISELTALTGETREHLQAAEDAFQDVILANTVTASGKGLDIELLARATVTLILTVAARQAQQNAESSGQKIDPCAFAELADSAFKWGICRIQSRNILH